MSYSDRLAALNLPSLELRRLRNDLIWCHKILFGVVEMPVDSFFELSLVKHTRGHCFKLFKRRSNTCARSSFFSERVVIAKFHYTDTDTDPSGPARTQRSFAAKKSMSVSCPCRARVRVRVVEFSSYPTTCADFVRVRSMPGHSVSVSV